MKSIKSGIYIAALGTIMSFLSVAYMSCNKAVLNPVICQDLVCENGGHCYSDTVSTSLKYNTHYCICPFGFQGDSCTTRATDKFVGNWGVTEQCTSSNNPAAIAKVNQYNIYNVTIAGTGAPYVLFINNLNNNTYFTQVSCVIDSVHYGSFKFNLFTPANNGNTHITGGTGVSANGDDAGSLQIKGAYYINWLNPKYKNGFVYETDTISYTMNRIY